MRIKVAVKINSIIFCKLTYFSLSVFPAPVVRCIFSVRRKAYVCHPEVEEPW
jgi:hypothetical protein